MTSPVDLIASDCQLTPWRGDQKRCRWCNSPLRYPRRVWCGEGCQLFYQMNHVWWLAKIAARNRDGGCVECRTDPAERPGLREAHHVFPRGGTRTSSCAHHQTNLVTLCAHHHAARHLATA